MLGVLPNTIKILVNGFGESFKTSYSHHYSGGKYSLGKGRGTDWG